MDGVDSYMWTFDSAKIIVYVEASKYAKPGRINSWTR
jgi:hypothetical protein